jgi:hypothetical protein
MSDFEREERYIVIKLEDLDDLSHTALQNFLIREHISTREAIVVESDWSIYDDVWEMVEGMCGYR